ncbi:MAG TPA: hypothetical protein VIZ17_20975 [Acetobacteraceae bacterium]
MAVTKPAVADSALRQRLTIASLSDNQLGDIRGGLDAGSGVELNFAFQQATLVDHNVVQNIVLPTLTVATNSAGNPAASVSSIPAGSISGSNIAASPVSTASFAGLGMAGAPSETVANTLGATTIINNGQSLQISPGVSPGVGSGVTSVISTLGGMGLTNIVRNTANNQLVQQVTTVNIGITGLQQLLQQTVPSSVMNQLNSVNALHH